MGLAAFEFTKPHPGAVLRADPITAVGDMLEAHSVSAPASTPRPPADPAVMHPSGDLADHMPRDLIEVRVARPPATGSDPGSTIVGQYDLATTPHQVRIFRRNLAKVRASPSASGIGPHQEETRGEVRGHPNVVLQPGEDIL